MALVYQHRRKDTNEIFYIGIGKESSRAFESQKRNQMWKNIVNKSGGYNVDILIDGCTWQEACEVEKGMISSYGRRDIETGILCNLTDGGEGALGTTFNRGRVRSKDFKNKVRDFMKGNTINCGRQQSEETRLKISNKLKGIKRKPRTKEHSAKIVASIKKNKYAK